MKDKNTLVASWSHEVVCFQMLYFETSNSKIWGLENKFVEFYLFLENYVTSDGAVSHNVLYYPNLTITRTQERFYDDNYVE